MSFLSVFGGVAFCLASALLMLGGTTGLLVLSDRWSSRWARVAWRVAAVAWMALSVSVFSWIVVSNTGPSR